MIKFAAWYIGIGAGLNLIANIANTPIFGIPPNTAGLLTVTVPLLWPINILGTVAPAALPYVNTAQSTALHGLPPKRVTPLTVASGSRLIQDARGR